MEYQIFRRDGDVTDGGPHEDGLSVCIMFLIDVNDQIIRMNNPT